MGNEGLRYGVAACQVDHYNPKHRNEQGNCCGKDNIFGLIHHVKHATEYQR